VWTLAPFFFHVAGCRYSNGDIYAGQWKMNKRHGQVIADHFCISIVSDWCYQCDMCVFALLSYCRAKWNLPTVTVTKDYGRTTLCM
jgi:hypothetical protein